MLTCSGYWDGGSGLEASVVTWDLQTGGVVSAIERQVLGDFLSTKTLIAYSTNGRMVAVVHQDNVTTLISIYDVISGVYSHDVYHDTREDVYYHQTQRHSLHGQRWCDIWSHGESLRFATTTLETITVREVGFAPGAVSKEIDTLSIPDKVKPAALAGLYMTEPVVTAKFLPTSSRLALLHYRVLGGVLVWDAQRSKSLLHRTDIGFYPEMTFSSDGRFFACSTSGSEVYLWKESPTGYVLHGILTPGTRRITPLLSPNGELVITHGFGSSVAQLWRTKSFTTTPNDTIQDPQRIENFVLEFLPDRLLAAVARQKDDAVTILDLKSGLPRLTINAGMEVYGLTAIGNTVVVLGDEKAITWDLPGEIFLPKDWMNVEDSVRTMSFSDVRNGYVSAATISSDFGYIAVIAESYPGSGRLYVYSTTTGTRLDDAITRGSTLWFLPGQHKVGWVADGKEGETRGITARYTLDYTRPIGDIEHGQWGCPHGSSHGYQVTNDGWIISPSRKRLLMLPPPLRSDTVRRVWNGRFLSLLHGSLSEPVILELEP